MRNRYKLPVAAVFLVNLGALSWTSSHRPMGPTTLSKEVRAGILNGPSVTVPPEKITPALEASWKQGDAGARRSEAAFALSLFDDQTSQLQQANQIIGIWKLASFCDLIAVMAFMLMWRREEKAIRGGSDPGGRVDPAVG